jgi:hypothetical protein
LSYYSFTFPTLLRTPAHQYIMLHVKVLKWTIKLLYLSLSLSLSQKNKWQNNNAKYISHTNTNENGEEITNKRRVIFNGKWYHLLSLMMFVKCIFFISSLKWSCPQPSQAEPHFYYYYYFIYFLLFYYFIIYFFLLWHLTDMTN